jgi:hypothetical protein
MISHGSHKLLSPLIVLCRSVHNIRIERLWVDITSGFGKKWHDFFTVLESREGLNTNLDAHIWLIHHLFLQFINHDAPWPGTPHPE